MKLHVVMTLAVMGLSGSRCAEGVDGEPAPMCTSNVGCPAGTVCFENMRCMRIGDGGTPQRMLRAQRATAPEDFLVAVPVEPPTLPPNGCPAGQIVCGQTCVDPLRDGQHCGGCGIACRLLEPCVSGLCCSAPREVCDGVCVDTTSSEANCGVCGFACPEDLICVFGGCVPSPGP